MAIICIVLVYAIINIIVAVDTKKRVEREEEYILSFPIGDQDELFPFPTRIKIKEETKYFPLARLILKKIY